MEKGILLIEEQFFLKTVAISDTERDLSFTGFELIGRLHTIEEETLKSIIRTKPYGSEPYFCTMDYNYYDPEAKFNAGFCVGHDHQYRLSLYSYLSKKNLLLKDTKWYNGELQKEDKNYYIYVSKTSK